MIIKSFKKNVQSQKRHIQIDEGHPVPDRINDEKKTKMKICQEILW